MLNFPLICQPCRNALFRLLNGSGCVKATEAPLTESLDGAREMLGEMLGLRTLGMQHWAARKVQE